MSKHETTIHGPTGSVTLMVDRGKVLIETVATTPAVYPDTRPGQSRQVVVVELTDFLLGAEYIMGAVAGDEAVPATVRAEAWHGDLEDVLEVVAAAAVEDDADLTRAGERSDWLLDQVGIGATNWRVANAEENERRRQS